MGRWSKGSDPFGHISKIIDKKCIGDGSFCTIQAGHETSQQFKVANGKIMLVEFVRTPAVKYSLGCRFIRMRLWIICDILNKMNFTEEEMENIAYENTSSILEL